MRRMAGQGGRASRRAVMTVGERSGSGSAAYSIDTGRMSMAERKNSAKTGDPGSARRGIFI